MPRLSLVAPPLAAAALIAVAGATSGASAPPRGSAAPRAPLDRNPCITPQAKTLRCPDLVMKKPWGMYASREGRRTLLHAGNSIDSVGAGPAELFGVRDGPRSMRARQRIYRRGRGRLGLRTGARLQFKFAHLNRRWWKFFHAARFELWRVDHDGRRKTRVRVGPKVSYCLRDLEHSRPQLRRSPKQVVYPACSTSPLKKKDTLGTSVGWSDVYPPTYPEQWIDVTGLKGCFAYVHIADPRNGIYESNEDNNESQVIVRLPWAGAGNHRCPGHSRGPSSRGEPGAYG
jgi:lysyl oxidase